MHEPIPLQLLPAGRRAEVVDLVGLPEDVLRLEELGIRRGRTVEMVQAGTPCIVRLDGHKFCFRAGELFSVLVREASLASPAGDRP